MTAPAPSFARTRSRTASAASAAAAGEVLWTTDRFLTVSDEQVLAEELDSQSDPHVSRPLVRPGPPCHR